MTVVNQKRIKNFQFATVAEAEAAVNIDNANHCMIGEKQAIYIYLLWDTHIPDWDTYLNADGGLGRRRKLSPASATVIKKPFLEKNVKEVVTHWLGTGSLHISAYQNWHPVEVGINDVTEQDITVTSQTSWLFTFVITKMALLPWSLEYKNYACIANTGLVITELVNFTTENTYLGWDDVADILLLDWKLYVLTHTQHMLHELDPITWLDLRTPIDTGSQEWTISTDGRNLYIGWYNSSLLKVNISSWSLTASIALNQPIWHIHDVEREVLYVIESGWDLVEVDVAWGAFVETRRVTLPFNASSRGNFWWIQHRQNFIYVSEYYIGGGWATNWGRLFRVNKTDFTLDNTLVTDAWGGVMVLVGEEVIYPLYNANKVTRIDTRTNTINSEFAKAGVWGVSNVRNKLITSWRNTTNIEEYNMDTNSWTGRLNDVGWNPEYNRTF